MNALPMLAKKLLGHLEWMEADEILSRSAQVEPLGVAASSARFKKAIKPMDHASQAIHRLEPVTFRYNEELDPNGIPQFGLVAKQVAKVNPDLVARDGKGEIYTVRYDAVNAMLLNEFLKEHRKVEEQGRLLLSSRSKLKLTATIQKSERPAGIEQTCAASRG